MSATPAPLHAPVHARVRYTEPMVRRAVRTFVWRSLRRRAWLWAAATALSATSALLGAWSGQLAAAAWPGLCALLAIPLFWAAVWRAHASNTVGRFRSLDPPEADVAVNAEGITLASSRGRVTLPWSSIEAAWTLPDCRMLFTAPNQFMTLPTAGLPPAMEALLRVRLPPAPPGW